MHAIERILYSKSTPSRAIEFEKTLPGYRPAAYPATADDASKFKTQLLQRLIDDVAIILGQWKAAPVDPGIAFYGLVLLMNEQQEKVNQAATGEEESRYADVTLFDLRHNLEGTSKCYAVFRPWVLAHGAAGQKADKAIVDGFASLEKLYGSKGDAIAQPPATWSSIHPSEADLATPFGELFRTVSRAVDADTPGTLVSEMNRVQELLGFPAFKRR
jgi:iron uptake system component EfeO